MRQFNLHSVVIMGFSCLLLIGCSADNQTEEKTPFVLSSQIEQGAFLQWYLNGQISAQRQADLSFQVAGLVSDRFVNSGAQVTAGQVLLKLDPTDIQLRQRAAEANLRATDAEYALAQIEAQRAQDLLARKLVSQQDYDRAQNLVTTLKQRQTGLQRELELVKRQLSYTELKAPAAGYIQNVNVDAGQVVQVGQAVAGFIYSDGLDILVEVPESRIETLPHTAQAQLRGQQNLIEVQLRELVPKSNEQSRTWQARFALPTDISAQLGQTARLSFGDNSALYKIPLSAIFEQAQGPHIWLIQNQQVQPQAVTIKHLGSDYALIEANIPADSRIVKAGTHLLKAGQNVRERTL